MKHKRIITCLLTLLGCMAANALDFEVDGIKYTTVEGGVEVTGYNKNYEGDIVLNGTVTYGGNEYNIVSIKGSNYDISGCFYNCDKLKAVNDLSSCVTIGGYAFYNCRNLMIVGDLSACTSIGSSAFYQCKSLTNVGDLSACTSIGDGAFSNCSSLTSVDLSACTSIGGGAFSNCSSLISVGDLSACTSIGRGAFSQCSSLSSVGDLSACTSIGISAFSNCSSLSSVGTIGASCSSIGSDAFFGTRVETLILLASTPPVFTSSNSSSISDRPITFLVPSESVEAYRAADFWSDIKMQVISKDAQHDWNVATPVLSTIGAANFENVMTLKLTGDIDSDDMIYIRNKMFNLHYLDLEDANFVDSDKEYMSGECTHADEVCGFQNLKQLYSVILPKSIKTIGNNAFSQCSNLENITMQEGLERIGQYAFWNCKNMELISFPSTLKSIESKAFYYMTSLSSIKLPPGLISIGDEAFFDTKLSELRIPSSVEYIGAQAFICNQLKDIYAYTAEPININTNTFSTYSSATLHVFKMDNDEIFNNYYADAQWGQFPSIVTFEDEYKYFYLNNDMTLESRFTDEPDFNGKAGSTIEVVGDSDQDFDDIVLDYSNEKGASVIADENVKANTITFRLPITGSRWHFYTFPFRVKLSNVVAPGTYVFRRYDGAARALSGATGWAALEEGTEWLEPGVGYIFQCTKSGTLKITVEQPDFYWHGNLKKTVLTAHLTGNGVSNEHASWNFVGNPMTNYYDIDDMHYDAPLTIWDGSKYVAYRPGDDDYQLRPFEAFFLQKPEGHDGPQYDKDCRMGYNAAQKAHVAKARRTQRVNSGRQLLNLVLSNGKDVDRTRVVFNQQYTSAYELECDAAKFISTEQVPQLYTVDQQVRYAINERQQGTVQLAYVAPTAGSYTISAPRMDKTMLLKDLTMGTTFDLCNGEYTFDTEAGTFEGRFVLVAPGETNAIKNVETLNTESTPAYTLDGKLLPEGQKGQKGIVVVKGKKMNK